MTDELKWRMDNYGMDHEYYDWDPIVRRGVLRWPDNARIAFCVLVRLEHYEWDLAPGALHSHSLTAPMRVSPDPDYHTVTHREYGHRVGIFRVLETLDKHGIKATVAMDALTALRYPTLVKECTQRGYEVVGHGIGVRRMISSQMSEDEERQYINESLEPLVSATGKRPAGWLGPEYGESERTPRLLAEAGIRYVCDWCNDEQPYPMKVPTGNLYALPILTELDDVEMSWNRRVPIWQWSQMVRESFDVQYVEGAQSGLLTIVSVNPFFIGQPHRIAYLDEVLTHITRRQGVWQGTGSEIIDWYADHPPAR